MSKFAYKAEGELNSQYLFDLLKEYLQNLLTTNNTKGVVEGEYKIDPNKSAFVQWFADITKRIFNDDESLDNYNRVLATEYVKAIENRADIFEQTNVLAPKQVVDLKHTLQAIYFDSVIPLLERSREKAIKTIQKQFLKVIKLIKYLKHSKTNYILFNSPVEELKPFLSDKVAEHNINTEALIQLVKQFVNVKYNELNDFNIEPTEVKFVAKNEDFYNDKVTDSGVGEEVEQFIRSKMLEKVEILKHDEELKEDLDEKIAEIDLLLKKLKLSKIEKMLQEIIVLKTNIAQVKEVVDSCKDIINTSIIPNKSQIFLVMDNLYYKLSKKCETLEQNAKQKLQLIDKQKMFAMLESIEAQAYNTTKTKKLKQTKVATNIKSEADAVVENEESVETTKKLDIASNLYDDDDEENEIHVTEDDDTGEAEEEIVIEDEK